jgi:hypothetical protein
MTNTPKLLAQLTLAAGSNTVYTVPALTTAVIGYVCLTNTDTNAVTVDIIAGDSGSEKIWRDDLTLTEIASAPSNTVEFTGTFVLSAADVLKMTPSTGAVVDVLVMGFEVT